MNQTRCSWANMANPRYIAYHDHEWGVPCHDETTLFEMLNLEGAQAGLSWETILNKRDSYRAAFDNWDAQTIARYDDAKVAELLANPGIVRNRLKVAAAIGNADSQQLAGWRASREDRAVGPHLERPVQTRLQVRRLDHRLCLPAGHRRGGRP